VSSVSVHETMHLFRVPHPLQSHSDFCFYLPAEQEEATNFYEFL